MRIAHVMAGARLGGAEVFFERIAGAMHGTGDAVLPVIRSDPARAARLSACGLAPVQLRFGGPLDLVTRFRLPQHLARFAPDVVMAWMGRGASSTPRGAYVLLGRLGGTYGLRRFRHCDHLVVNTRGLVRYVEGEGWPADRVHHLPNFSPDFGGAPPASLPVPQGAPIVLAMGRLHPNKAFDTLIRAMPLLPHAHAVIAGDGPDRQALTALAAELGVADRVHLLGWRTDQAALLAAATVLAVPSRVEPLGNVVLEAFSARVPVVAADADGPRETIRPGESGLLVPIDCVAALADGLGTVLGDAALAAALARAGRAEFEAYHAEAPVLSRWRSVIATLEPS